MGPRQRWTHWPGGSCWNCRQGGNERKREPIFKKKKNSIITLMGSNMTAFLLGNRPQPSARQDLGTPLSKGTVDALEGEHQFDSSQGTCKRSAPPFDRETKAQRCEGLTELKRSSHGTQGRRVLNPVIFLEPTEGAKPDKSTHFLPRGIGTSRPVKSH